MPKKVGYKTLLDLISAPIPHATKSYTPISHEEAITTIQDMLDDYGYEIEETIYRANENATQAYGYFVFRASTDPEIKGLYAFQNSYDKTMRFTGAVGVKIDNEAVVISNSQTHMRKHTGSAFIDIKEGIESQISNASIDVSTMITRKNDFSMFSMSKIEYGRLVGELLIEDILMPDQATAAARAWPKNPGRNALKIDNITLWEAYKFISKSVQLTTPMNWMKNLTRLYWYLTRFCIDFTMKPSNEEIQNALAEQSEGFDNTTIDDHSDLLDLNSPQIDGIPNGDTISDTSDEDIEPIDPNQVDLEDSIADVEAESNQLTEEELSSQLHGVDNNPEGTFKAEQEEEEDNQETDIRLPETETENDTGEDPEETGKDLQMIPVDALEDAIEEEEFTYIPINDLYGMNVGDFVEVEGIYYKYADTIAIDGEVYGKCTPIKEEKEEQEELPIETVDADKPIEWVEAPEDPKIREVIKDEIYRVYGSSLDFKFEKVQNMYHITLENSESISLPSDYIDSI